MKTTILSFFCSLVACVHLFADDATPAPNQHRMGASPIQKTARIDGVQYQTLAELQAAVGRLPAGSTLRWDWGCWLFTDVPLGDPPRMSIADFKQFCTDHGVTLQYGHYSGW